MKNKEEEKKKSIVIGNHFSPPPTPDLFENKSFEPEPNESGSDGLTGLPGPSGEVSIMSFEQLTNQQIAKLDVITPAIEKLKEEYMVLKINGIDDSDGYDAVAKALKFMVSKRNEVEARRKELKADSIVYQKKLDDRAKEITGKLSPIETYLREVKQKIDDENERIEKEKERIKQQKLQDRFTALISAGMTKLGGAFMWSDGVDHESILEINVEIMEDEEVDAYVDKIDKLNTFFLEKKAAKERLEQEENDRKAAELKKLNDELEQMRSEQDAFRKTRMLTRQEQMHQLGLVHNDTDFVFKTYNEHSIPLVSWTKAYEMDSEPWLLELDEIKVRLVELRTADAANKQAHEDKIRQDLLDKQKEDTKKAEDAEKERVALLTDKEKLVEYAKKLLKIDPPEFKMDKYKKILEGIIAALKNYTK